jgi:predicted DNA-binding transcriptional regulator AlpA
MTDRTAKEPQGSPNLWVEQDIDHWIRCRIKGVPWFPAETPEHPVLIKRAEVVRRIGLSYMAIFNMIKAGKFPRAIKLEKFGVHRKMPEAA